MRYFGVLAFVAATLAPASALAADFTVSGTFPTYTINGQGNPPLTLSRGTTYTFDVSAAGHPFFIKTQQVTGSGSTFDTGVTNNGVQTGTLTFAVPASAPSTLFYQCGVHVPMTGTITIAAAPASAAPSAGPYAVALLALALGGAGFWGYRKTRPRSAV